MWGDTINFGEEEDEKIKTRNGTEAPRKKRKKAKGTFKPIENIKISIFVFKYSKVFLPL